MAIVQISKIQHRTGQFSDLPQLDIGEIGFATDQQRVFIGNDPALFPAEGNGTTQTEILTTASPNIGFGQIAGTANTSFNIPTYSNGTPNVSNGEVLTFNTNSWIPAGGINGG